MEQGRNEMEMEQPMALVYDGISEEQLLEELAEAKRSGRLPSISRNMDRRCRSLIRKTFRQKRKATRCEVIRKNMGKAAVAGAVSVCILSAMINSVQAIRSPAFRILFGKDKSYSTIIAGNITGPVELLPPSRQMEARKESPLVGLIPEDYKIQKLVYHENDGVYCFYKNEVGETVVFWAKRFGGLCNFDTEDAQVSQIKILDHDGVMVVKNGCHVYWMDDSAGILFHFATSAELCSQTKSMAEIVAQCPDWVTLLYGEVQ